VGEPARLAAFERRLVRALEALRAQERAGEEEAEAVGHERAVDPETSAGEGVVARDPWRDRQAVALPARRHAVGSRHAVPGRTRPPRHEGHGRARSRRLGRDQRGSGIDRLEPLGVDEEERDAGAVGIGEVGVPEPPRGLGPRCAVDAEEPRLAHEQTPGAHAVEDRGGVDGLEQRPHVVAGGHVAKDLLVEGGAGLRGRGAGGWGGRRCVGGWPRSDVLTDRGARSREGNGEGK
jgi:hypothetical protein